MNAVDKVVGLITALRDGPVTIRQLAERMGLSDDAVARLVDDLRALADRVGARIDLGEVQPEIGRPTRTYRLTAEAMRVLFSARDR